MSPNQFSYNSPGAPAALERQGKSNALIKMMERFDGQHITS